MFSICRHSCPPLKHRRLWASSRQLWGLQERLLTTGKPHIPPNDGSRRRRNIHNPWIFYPTAILLVGGAGFAAFQNYQPLRHTALAAVRCSRVAGAAITSAIDYKIVMSKEYDSPEGQNAAYSACHTRSARRVLKALLANGGIFIKLGQHMASLIVLPKEWTMTMSVLQDKCEPSDYEALERLFLNDMGVPLEELFDDFNPVPVGVASLAQVHVARHRGSGRWVAVKLQHPHLAEFCDVDMDMVDATLGWIKHWFPEFELTWLAEEMRTNLPKEMDFVHEAMNTERAVADFANLRTSLHIPEVLYANKRVLVMEYIQGSRVDDLEYLASCNIDRNKVAIEISRIFSQMLFINGWFHADPHPGNILIRPSPPGSRSPHNFEIVLLDHGLYFDMEPELRVNYSRLWLSLIEPSSPDTNAKRRKYAELVGNIGPDLYPVFEAAITGRVALEGGWEDTDDSIRRASSLIDLVPQTEAEKDAIRNAVVSGDGVLQSVFDVLRRVPRRVLMILKLNDLTRSLDHALMTTHSNVRVFLVMAKYCLHAVWQDDRERIICDIRGRGLLSFSGLSQYFVHWWRYEIEYTKLSVLERLLDAKGSYAIWRAWFQGLLTRGWKGAHHAASGLAYT